MDHLCPGNQNRLESSLNSGPTLFYCQITEDERIRRWRACNPHWGKPSNWFSICYSVAVWHCGSWLFPSYTQGETSCTTKAFLPNKSLVLSWCQWRWCPVTFESQRWRRLHFWCRPSLLAKVLRDRPETHCDLLGILTWIDIHPTWDVRSKCYFAHSRGFAKAVETNQRFLSCHLSHRRDKPQVEEIVISLCIIPALSLLVIHGPHWFVDFQKSSSLHEFLGSKRPLKGSLCLDRDCWYKEGWTLLFSVGKLPVVTIIHVVHSRQWPIWPMLFFLTWWFTAEAFACVNLIEPHDYPA